MNDYEQTILESRIKASLDNMHALDSDTKKQLRTIRRQALNPPKKASWFKSNYWAPAAGFAICSVIAVTITLPYLQPTHNTPLADQTAMIELLDNPDDLDALSDPGFYMWMDEMEKQKGASNAA